MGEGKEEKEKWNWRINQEVTAAVSHARQCWGRTDQVNQVSYLFRRVSKLKAT
jgi:hypothetical protein